MALGDKRDRAQAYRIVLADDRLRELLAESREEIRGGADYVRLVPGWAMS